MHPARYLLFPRLCTRLGCKEASVCAAPPVRRILPAGLRSLPRRVSRFSIKRKTSAPEETPHPENPACNKRPSGHNFCPDGHLRHIKYHRNKALSSRKTSKNRFFSTFNTEKRHLTLFCIAFRHISRLARSAFRSSTQLHPFASLLSQNGMRSTGFASTFSLPSRARAYINN